MFADPEVANDDVHTLLDFLYRLPLLNPPLVLTLMNAVLSTVLALFPFESGSFFFQQSAVSPPLKIATAQKQSTRQISLHQSMLCGRKFWKHPLISSSKSTSA